MLEYIPEEVRTRVTSSNCIKCCYPYAERDILGVGFEFVTMTGKTYLVVNVRCSLCWHRSAVTAGYPPLDTTKMATSRGPDLFKMLKRPPPPKAAPAPVRYELDLELFLCHDGVPTGWVPDMPTVAIMWLRMELQDTSYCRVEILGGYQPFQPNVDLAIGPPRLLYKVETDAGLQSFDLIAPDQYTGRATRDVALSRLRWTADWYRFGSVPPGAIFKIGDDRCIRLTDAEIEALVSKYVIWQDGRSPGRGQHATSVGLSVGGADCNRKPMPDLSALGI